MAPPLALYGAGKLLWPLIGTGITAGYLSNKEQLDRFAGSIFNRAPSNPFDDPNFLWRDPIIKGSSTIQTPAVANTQQGVRMQMIDGQPTIVPATDIGILESRRAERSVGGPTYEEVKNEINERELRNSLAKTLAQADTATPPPPPKGDDDDDDLVKKIQKRKVEEQNIKDVKRQNLQNILNKGSAGTKATNFLQKITPYALMTSPLTLPIGIATLVNRRNQAKDTLALEQQELDKEKQRNLENQAMLDARAEWLYNTRNSPAAQAGHSDKARWSTYLGNQAWRKDHGRRYNTDLDPYLRPSSENKRHWNVFGNEMVFDK